MPNVDWQDLAAAFALYLVLEGFLPALAPERFRDAAQALAGLDARTLRIMGVGSMVAGAFLLSLIRS